jgi:hypothetical protein
MLVTHLLFIQAVQVKPQKLNVQRVYLAALPNVPFPSFVPVSPLGGAEPNAMI